MKILYTGSAGPLSVIPLEYLLVHGYELCGVVVDAPSTDHRGLPALLEHAGTVEQLARFHGLPIVPFREAEHAPELVKALAPDVLLCSCFPYRLPEPLIALPAFGSYNLHPSLLPAWRGPDPLFWQFRAGVGHFGVSWHRMTTTLDAGGVVGQAPVQMPDGVSASGAAVRAGQAGAGLLAGLLRALEQDMLDVIEQDETRASYRPLPAERDFVVRCVWPARRLFNFICATRDRVPWFPCTIDGQTYRLVRAVGWESEGSGPPVIQGNRIRFDCSPGRVIADFLA